MRDREFVLHSGDYMLNHTENNLDLSPHTWHLAFHTSGVSCFLKNYYLPDPQTFMLNLQCCETLCSHSIGHSSSNSFLRNKQFLSSSHEHDSYSGLNYS